MSKFDTLFLRVQAADEALHIRRRLRCVTPDGPGAIKIDGRTLRNFSSNDYLGLARHPSLVQRAHEWALTHGVGAQSSRLVCGHFAIHEKIESKIARAKGTEAALLMTSGWQANASVLPALLNAASKTGAPRVYADRLNHASLHHACQAAGVRQIRFKHNDLSDLERLLVSHSERPGPCFIVTESVFSMDGDRVDVVRLADIAARHRAFVYLDEAHATGVIGPHGMGLSALANGGVDLAMGTFSKALGGFGAYVAGSSAMCDFLVNKCSGFVFSTSLPPGVLGAIDAALDMTISGAAARSGLARQSNRLRSALRMLGFEVGASSTQIVPVMVGDAARALQWSAALEAAGFLVVAIRPPTVPVGTSRLRIVLSAAHTDEDVDALMATLADIMRRDGGWREAGAS